VVKNGLTIFPAGCAATELYLKMLPTGPIQGFKNVIGNNRPIPLAKVYLKKGAMFG